MICVDAHRFLPLQHAFIMKCRVYLLHCSMPHILFCCPLLSPVSSLHASTADLNISQFFTQSVYLPTIVCVMLMFGMYLI